MRLNIRVTSAATLAALGFGILAWGVLPAPTTTRSLNGASISAPDSARAALRNEFGSPDGDSSPYRLILEHPSRIREGDSALVRLRLLRLTVGQGATSVGPGPTATAGPSVIQEGRGEAMVLEARLELRGAEVTPAGEIATTWTASNGAEFVWAIQARRAGPLSGTVWLLLALDRDVGVKGQRAAVAALPLELAVRTILGLSGPASRITGSGIILMAMILGLPAIDHVLKHRLH